MRIVIAALISAVLTANVLALALKSEPNPVQPVPVQVKSSTTVAPGSFVVEGALAGGNGSLMMVRVHRVVSASPEAVSRLAGACPVIVLQLPDAAVAISGEGSVVPVAKVMGAAAYLSVRGEVQGDQLVYRDAKVIPAPKGSGTICAS